MINSDEKIPRNEDLENALLSLILQNPKEKLCRKLKRDLFLHGNRTLFDAMQALQSSGKLDYTMLHAQLRDAEKLESIGGNHRLKELVNDGALLPQFDYYVEKLRDYASRREGLTVADRLKEKAYALDTQFDPISIVDTLSETPNSQAFLSHLSAAAVGGEDFLTRDIPKRELILGEWFCVADAGFIFAPRGVGKTWFAYLLIKAISSGTSLGEWEIPKPRRVCLVDGEMPPDAVQSRLRSLEITGGNLTVISHQFLHDVAETSIELGDEPQRAALLEYCVTNSIEVLVLDNLSTLSNVPENDNDEWTVMKKWLLEFRRRGIAVIVIHHAGRNGHMRGASKREDDLFWVIKLEDSRERQGTTEGAQFITRFTKNRNCASCPTPTDWHISTEEGNLTIEYKAADNLTLILDCIRDGLDRCKDIAEELELSSATVSRAARQLESDGKVRIDGRGNQSRYNAV